MTEALLRDSIEIKRQQARESDVNRFGAMETAIAVLKTRFEAAVERAVQGEDLKELKRELEAEMNKQIGHICDHFDTQMKQQSRDLLNEFKAVLTTEQLAQSKALLAATADTRRELIRYVIGFALTVLSALVIFWLTRNG